MADKVRVKQLHPEVTVYIFRHGHAAQAENGEEGDFGRVLSPKGWKQAQQLGRTLLVADVGFDQVICSAAVRAQHTARHAADYFPQGCKGWYDGQGWELYSPKDVLDNRALWAVTHRVESQAKMGVYASPMSYAAFRHEDTTGFLDRFMEEVRQVVLGIPSIDMALRIAIFNHAVLGNAVAEALFPQHARALEGIELAPCDCIRLTEMSCKHFPLLVA